MTRDRAGLRQDPVLLASPDLVTTTGDRVFRTRSLGEDRVVDRIRVRFPPEPVHHESAGAVVKEGRVRVPKEVRNDGVALVSRASDRVERRAGRPHLACDEVQVSRDHLRLEEIEHLPPRHLEGRVDRLVEVPRPMVRPGPILHGLDEVLVDDSCAVEAETHGVRTRSLHHRPGGRQRVRGSSPYPRT